MIIHYSSKKDQRVFENERLLKKTYGSRAEEILIRLAEFEAAKSLKDISETPPPRRHKLSGKKNCWGIRISKNYRILLEPYGQWEDGNLSSIVEVKILSIEDYH